MKEIALRLSPEEAANDQAVRARAAQAEGKTAEEIGRVEILRRSIDARGRRPMVELRVGVHEKNEPETAEPALLSTFREVPTATPVAIVGAGPAGYFAALELIELGLKPVIFERGKDAQSRRRDLRAIQQFGEVNPHSNYCFGEGGAGTYSDGKLYTRSHKRGNIEKTLRLLVEHGAKTDILIDTHPHIGSNKLPEVVANIRKTILEYGGEIHFGAFVTDLIIHEKTIKGLVVNGQEEHFFDSVILATGHSARDVYQLLRSKEILLEAKPFALGVRIEHPQALIDSVQYKQSPRDPLLPAGSYSLTAQIEGRGVFSFCMCPGGLVVPSATAPGEIVVNGMSMSRRDSEFANAGTVVAVEVEDLKPYAAHGVFAAMALQQKTEQAMFAAGDGSQKAPAQRLTDFVQRRVSVDLPPSSYIPGLFSAPLHQLLPYSIYQRLQQGVLQFGKMMRGYLTEDANVIGTESRTSSPVRIPRNSETLMHPEIAGLFPCGEGAGYAGGILSAAMDGQKVAKSVLKWVNK